LGEALEKIAAGKAVDPVSVSQLVGVQGLVRAFQEPRAASFIQDLLRFDPRAHVAKLDTPILLLTGTTDQQVSPELDVRPLAEAAEKANGDVTLIVVEDADHVLKHDRRAPHGSAAAAHYNAPDRGLHPAVPAVIASWVKQRVPVRSLSPPSAPATSRGH
jgi:uncharacterized protein